MAADLRAILAFSTWPGSPPAVKYLKPPMVRNRVATPARIPTIQLVRLEITPLSDGDVAAAAGGAVAKRTTAAMAAAHATRRSMGRSRRAAAGVAGAGCRVRTVRARRWQAARPLWSRRGES